MTPPKVLSTPRLRLHPVAPGDVPAFHRQWNLPDVGRFLWDGKPVPLDTVEAVIAASQDAFARAGYGLWSLRPDAASPESEPLGFCGLRVPDGATNPEILFALDPSAWKHGYAREAAEAVLHHAFATLGLRRITAGANPDNPSSWRVLERVGLRRTGQVRTEIEDLYTYEIASPLREGPVPKENR